MAGDARAAGLVVPAIDGRGMRIGVVVARFNSAVTTLLLDGARSGLAAAHVAPSDVVEVWVPGGFEVPQAAAALAARGDIDAVIGLGCVVRGDTAHFEHVAGQAAAGIMRAGLDSGKPVMFGVLTTDTLAQAIERSAAPGDDHGHNVGADCAAGAVEMVALLRSLR